MDPLYQASVKCACCGESFKTSRVRPSMKRVKTIDSDFCGHYGGDVNPDFYVVRVCPLCGFASTENSISQLSDVQRQRYYQEVGIQWQGGSFGGERDLEQALTCYKLALLSANAVGEKVRVVSGILHHIAWLYRLAGKQEEEQRFLAHALAAYVRMYEQEADAVSNARLMYLIGELNRRLDKPVEAVRWYSRVINDQKITDAAMIRKCREQWQLIRQQEPEEIL